MHSSICYAIAHKSFRRGNLYCTKLDPGANRLLLLVRGFEHKAFNMEVKIEIYKY